MVSGIIGLIIAYVYKADAPAWIESHYRFQITTFWVSLVFFIATFILFFVFVGWLVAILWIVWLIIRVVKGLKYLSESRPIPNPGTWLFP